MAQSVEMFGKHPATSSSFAYLGAFGGLSARRSSPCLWLVRTRIFTPNACPIRCYFAAVTSFSVALAFSPARQFRHYRRTHTQCRRVFTQQQMLQNKNSQNLITNHSCTYFNIHFYSNSIIHVIYLRSIIHVVFKVF